jgi:hypothetical protein
MKNLITTGIIIVLLSSLVAAGIDCPCNRPGPPGKVVKFVARDGTADNVTFYTNDEPVLDDVMTYWAYKFLEDEGFETPVENLTVKIYMDDIFILERTTDEDGGFGIPVDSEGYYLVKGGDATINFTVGDLDKINAPLPPEPELISEPEPEPQEVEEPILPPMNTGINNYKSGNNLIPWLLIICGITLFVTGIILLKTKKVKK